MHPFPPGPPKLPLIGNVLHILPGLDCLAFANWGKKYNSDVIHVQAAGMNLVILNSAESAADLLEKRWRLYSDRPKPQMTVELMGWGWMFAAMSYGEEFRKRRKLLQEHFPPYKHEIQRPRITQFVHILLQQLYESPDKFLDHTRHALGGITLSLAYGINIERTNDPFIKLEEEAIRTLAIASVPGAFLVDIIPALKYVPEWFPGAGFKRTAREWKKLALASRDVPFEEGERRIREGVAKTSFISLSLDAIDPSKDTSYQRDVIKDAAGIFFAAGSDTTVQRKAQQELDTILNDGRLPTFKDESSLPYLSAVLKEVLRSRPPAPMGIPHSIGKDDVYNGYHIPAKSFVIPNIWGMLNNEEDYPNPVEFKPERFLKNGKLNPEIRDPATLLFGFGRSVPGAHIAWSSLWLSAASILVLFNIVPAVDAKGNIIAPNTEYHTAFI
ncbi:cytochrome P450 [Cyathus striatus]|nr:cytochrome P450 [Cyathus striatus]